MPYAVLFGVTVGVITSVGFSLIDRVIYHLTKNEKRFIKQIPSIRYFFEGIICGTIAYFLNLFKLPPTESAITVLISSILLSIIAPALNRLSFKKTKSEQNS